MTSLHATLRAALADEGLLFHEDDPREGSERRLAAAVVAWLADPATTTRAAEAIHAADGFNGGRSWAEAPEGWPEMYERMARAALGAITRNEASA